MPDHEERRVLPYAPEQMFDLVASVRDYPAFIPWVEALRVVRDDTHEGSGTLTADMLVRYKMFTETFRSDVTLDREALTIKVDYVRGPLKKLVNDWRFLPHPEGCAVDFYVAFEFRNRLMQMAAGQLMDKGFLKLVGAFEAEAARRYR
jgi:coenzyme Q-binding protein COQ10